MRRCVGKTFKFSIFGLDLHFLLLALFYFGLQFRCTQCYLSAQGSRPEDRSDQHDNNWNSGEERVFQDIAPSDARFLVDTKPLGVDVAILARTLDVGQTFGEEREYPLFVAGSSIAIFR